MRRFKNLVKPIQEFPDCVCRSSRSKSVLNSPQMWQFN
jgi:hypothetical protein